jgi:alpha-tubulin suppressor-like RCC1 family protein
MPGTGPWHGPWAQVSAGEDFVCAVERHPGEGDANQGGIAKCRGWNPFGQTDLPHEFSGKRWQYVSSGFQHACGVDVSGRTHCWGSDLFGESSLVPVVAASGVTLSTVAEAVLKAEDPTVNLSEAELTIAAQKNTLDGYAETRQNFAIRGDPADAFYANQWGSVAAGAHWTCGVFGPARGLACWGKMRAYTVGGIAARAYDEFGVVTPFGNSGSCRSWESVGAGKTHACAMGIQSAANTSALVCWGDDTHGQASPPSDVSFWRAWPSESVADDLGSAASRSRFQPTATCGQTSGSGRSAARLPVLVALVVARSRIRLEA